MERVVTVKFPPALDGKVYPYKTFFEVKSGDYVIVKSDIKGYAIAKVVCPDVPPNMHITDKSKLDYLVQPVNDLAYEHYKEKSKKLREAKALIAELSVSELEELAQVIIKRHQNN